MAGFLLAWRRTRASLPVATLLALAVSHAVLLSLAGLWEGETRRAARIETRASLGVNVTYRFAVGRLSILVPTQVGNAAPADGTMHVSAELRRLLEVDENSHLGAYLPWEVVGELGEELLAGPDELLAWVGAPAGPRLVAATPEPINRFPLVLVAVLVGVPSIAMILAALRADGRRREQRLEVLSILGAPRRTLRLAAATEALLTAVPAVGVASLGYLWIGRPLLATVDLGGASFFRSDLWPSVAGWIVVTLVTLTAAASAAWRATRHVTADSAIQSSSTSAMNTAGHRGILLIPIGASIVIAAAAANRLLPEWALIAGEGLGLGAVLVGIVIGGPTAVHRFARALLDTIDRSVAALVATRRLQHDPSGAFRAVSGVALIAFVLAFASTLNTPSNTVDVVAGYTALEIEIADSPVRDVLDTLDGIPGVVTVPVSLTGTGVPDGFGTTCDAFAWITETDRSECHHGSAITVAGFDHDKLTVSPVGMTPTGSAAGVEAAVVSTSSKLSRRFAELQLRAPNAQYVVALADDVIAGWPVSQLAVFATTDQAELSVIAAMARNWPSVPTGRASTLHDTTVSANTTDTALTLILGYSLLAALSAVLITIAETDTERIRNAATDRALGFGRDLRYKKTLWELGVPLTIGVAPTTLLGATLAFATARVLSGDARFPWLHVAGIWVIAACASAAVASAVSIVNARSDLNQPLRQDS